VRGGLTFREAHYVAEAVAATNRLVSLDLVEVNPILEGHEDEVCVERHNGRGAAHPALNLLTSFPLAL
jgi:arginase